MPEYMKNLFLTLTLCIFFQYCSFSQQPTNVKTANDYVKPYLGNFRYGSNMGYYSPYTDEQLADIAAKASINTLRPAFFEFFAEQWGYNVRDNAFRHYDSLGMNENVCFIGYPSPAHRDNTIYCGKDSSALFANMYEPIWDKGENGTPVNDKNYYALFVYKTVNRFKKSVKFWEIWNEPDFATTYSPEKAPGQSGAWWNTNPDPCEYAIHAPVQHYIRLLRISYEVIKSIDPDAYVCTGGIGFPSFMDVILRQTDNPKDGSVTPQYPLKGGAYFDVLSYHSYPHIDNSVRQWSDKIQGFEYFRHSDRAVEGIFKRKKDFDEVLNRFGYNGVKYPKKHCIITECNIPAKAVGEYMGSYEAQRNFLVKAAIKSQINGLLQFHVYSLGELTDQKGIRNEFDLMGLYTKLENTKPYSSTLTPSGLAYQTVSKMLYGYRYDVAETKKIGIPPPENSGQVSIDGAAFKNSKTKEVIYCLWAKTSKDLSEEAVAMFSLPDSFISIEKIKQLSLMRWDFSLIPKIETVTPKNIRLTSSPIFLKKKG